MINKEELKIQITLGSLSNKEIENYLLDVDQIYSERDPEMLELFTQLWCRCGTLPISTKIKIADILLAHPLMPGGDVRKTVVSIRNAYALIRNTIFQNRGVEV